MLLALTRLHRPCTASHDSSVTIPVELWAHISRYLSDEDLWVLRAVKFKTLDLLYHFNQSLDGQWNPWKARLDKLEKLLKFVEQPYIASRVCSIEIIPDLEYTLSSNTSRNLPPVWVQCTRRALRVLQQDSTRPLFGRPSYKEESKRAQKITSRLYRLLTEVITLKNICSLTIESGIGIRDTEGSARCPPHDHCGYITSLLKSVSPHLVYLELDLSDRGRSLKGLNLLQAHLAFPELETLVVHVEDSSISYLHLVQHFLCHSHRLRKASLRFWLHSIEGWNNILLPVSPEGHPLPTIQTLDIGGTNSLPSEVLDMRLGPILPQLRNLILKILPSPSPNLISKLNTQQLRTLNLGQLEKEECFLAFCNTFAGGDSSLEELSLAMWGLSLGHAEKFPVFVRLKSLSLDVADWNISFLTRVPICAPALASLTIRAETGIFIPPDVLLLGYNLYEKGQFLIKEHIYQLNCPHWAKWGLRNFEIVAMRVFIHGERRDSKLWTPIKAFAKKVPSLEYWMGDIIGSS
ncbi:hypothetical protein DL96DRAFT_1628761 [Flagelloscypha sp. PMI_526]|nr:hypothetical protein DL96DRAFT_1628761 [Flagelloscypha sp. PMI_526]